LTKSKAKIQGIFLRAGSRLHCINKIPWHSFGDAIKKYQSHPLAIEASALVVDVAA